MDAIDLLKLLLDAGRLAVVGAVAARPGDTDDLARRADVDRRAVLETLAPLLDAGLVIREGDVYRLDRRALAGVAQALPQPAEPDARVMFGMTGEEQEVLRRFFSGSRLVEIPTTRAKRRIVLDRLALEFEPGRHYQEAEVNAILQRFHSDHASLRRYLVDEGLLDREAGEYWRAGGRVVDPRRDQPRPGGRGCEVVVRRAPSDPTAPPDLRAARRRWPVGPSGPG